MFQSVPINRLLGITLIENIMGSRVHGLSSFILCHLTLCFGFHSRELSEFYSILIQNIPYMKRI